MSVSQILRAVELFRSFGVPVTFEPGWDTRGNGQSSAYQGGVLHHTAGSYAATCPGILIHGRSDLSGPLCNYAGLSGGGIHVVAAHPANHAGASGGPSVGPFPVTGLFNKLVMGLEICYPGSSPMTDAQYRTARVFVKVMEIMFGSVERARAHRETSVEGKWDPGWAPGQTINMAELRASAGNLEGNDMTPDQFVELLSQMARNPAHPGAEALREIVVKYKMPKAEDGKPTSIHDETRWASANFREIRATVAALEAKVNSLALGGGTVDVAALADAVNDEDDRRDRDDDPNTGARS